MTTHTPTATPSGSSWRTWLLLLLFFCFAAPAAVQAQCLLAPVSLQDRTQEASLIVEGRVTQQVSFWNAEHSMIYTANAVEVYKVLKGSLTATHITVITDGGTVWPDKIVVTPALSFQEGDMGVLFLAPNTVSGANFSSAVYQPVADEQGFVQYDPETPNRAEDPFTLYTNVPVDLFAVIEQFVGQQARVLQTPPVILPSGGKGSGTTPFAAPVISSFSPTTITAGTRSILTINGSNFGTNTSSAKVQFRSADNGGSSFMSALSTDIVSWTNTQIQVRVPSGAGTGTVRVINNTNETGTSSSTLTILYNHTNVENSGTSYAPRLVSDNGQGGYTMSLNTSFNSNTNAKAAFQRALETWRCNTFVNFNISSTTSSISTAASDNVNIVTFGTLPSGVLGRTTSYYSGCFVSGGANFYVTEIDQVYAPSGTINWNFATTNATASQMDFQSVVVHELGHAHQLGHIIFSGRIMHFNIGNGQTQRVLNQASDIDGGNAVMTTSTANPSVCNQTRMTAVTAGTCSLTPSTAPVADFSATPTSTTTGQTVTFTDLTTNNPTSWSWSITPATHSYVGGTSATSQNPQVTFSAAGQYTVTLTATNSAGSDGETKTNYITISPYCIPQYSTTAGQGTADGDFVNSVVVGTISNLNTGTAGGPTYSDFTNLSTNMARNSSQTLNVTIGTYGDNNSILAAWIDWNRDGDFDDAGEKVGERRSLSPNQTVTFNFTVPGGASIGTTRMRIRSVWSNAVTTIEPCTSYNYGEAEDYTINITTGTAAAPVAAFVGAPTTVSIGQTVTFTDQSTNSPTSWAWSITPATHSYVGGTSASSQNPQVTFSAAGQYTVTLTATNATGSDDEVKTNYITVTSVASAACDTLNFRNFNAPSLYSVAGGFWPGHHNFSGVQVREFAQQFTAAGQSHLNGVYMQFARARTLNPTTSSITVRLYNNNAGVPGAVLASQNVLIQTIANAVANPNLQGLIFVDFGGSTALPGNNFFVGFQINYVAGDTVALVANDITQNTVNTGFAFLPAPTSAWQPMSAIFQNNPNWRLAIFAEVGPKPVAGFTTSSNSVCTGQTVQFTSTATNTGSHFWAFPGGTPSQSTAANPTVTYATAGTYNVSYYAVGSCGGVDSVIATNRITVSTPTPLTGTATPATVCAGASSTLSITGAGPFEWLDGATVIGTGNSVSVTPTATKSYTVRQAGATCSSQGTVTVTVNPLPTVDAGTDVTVCGTGSVPLSGTATGGSNLQYAWTPTTGLSTPNQSSTLASPVQTTTYTLTVTNPTTGCVATDKVIVTVAQPTAAIITSNGLTSICPGGAVALAGNSGTGFQYQWLRNNSPIGAANSVNYTANQAGDYAMILTDGNGCRDTSNSITVTVLTPPSATISVSGPTVVCQGDSVVLNAPVASNYIYTWMLNGVDINGANDSVFAAKQSGNYQLVLREFGNNCSDTSAVIAVSVNPSGATPAISVVSGSLNFCQGDSVVLDGGAGFANYRWSNGSTGRFITVKTTTSTLTVVADNGCGDQTSPAVNVQALPVPTKPTITQNGGVLSTSSTEPNYQWQLAGSNISGATSSSFTPTQSGSYTVTVRNAAGCSATSDPFNFSVSAIDPATVAVNTLFVYPNPTISILNIRVNMPTTQPVALRMFDVNGKEVLAQDLSAHGNSFDIPINIDHLSAGTYFVEVQMGAKLEIRKVVKQ